MLMGVGISVGSYRFVISASSVNTDVSDSLQNIMFFLSQLLNAFLCARKLILKQF